MSSDEAKSWGQGPALMIVSVAIPVLNGAATLDEVLTAVRTQQIEHDVELLLCDSGSSDGSDDLAERHGARLLRIPREQFSHGGTRNLLMSRAAGTFVAFLTQDAVPAGRSWLSSLVGGFELAANVGLVYGPYVPDASASVSVRRELSSWFGIVSPDGAPRVDRLEPHERPYSARSMLGPRAFFTDANGCVRRESWERVPFREVPYAEDHQLALDMLDAGYAKAFVPDAAVVHSHEYSAAERLRRGFDESRALREIYGYVEPVGIAAVRARVIGNVRADLRLRRREGARGGDLFADVLPALSYHAARHAGAVLGSRADRLPRRIRGHLSLEGRSTFVSSGSADAR